MRIARFLVGVLLVALGASACAVDKSSNPLSPNVAGPIPGVAITAPDIVTPTSGARISTDLQPITLTLQNASSSGVRPLSYTFQVAADANFSNVLVSRSGITPGDGGRTSFKLPDALESQKTYYWRARAEDGANTGSFSAPSVFTIFTPVVLQAPGLVSPVGATTIDSLSPRFVVQNSARSGPAGQVSYLIELSTTDSFSPVLAAWVFDEQPNQSALNAPVGLSYSSTYFWRARAFESTASSAFSAPQAFKTPAAPSVPTGGGSGGSGGSTPTNCSTPAGADGINMNQAVIENSPVDLASWCVGAKITNITFLANSFRVEFSRRDGGNRWPDFVPPGWGGPLQYTLGMCLQINGRWSCSAVVEFWYQRSLDESAPPWAISRDWFYDGRWGTLAGKQPATGEQVGIFVCAGDCRNKTVSDPGSLKERSNIQIVPWSNSGGPSYSY
ncbi:MAG: hypothetical protein U0Q11_21535 [Vicinamibacterales bacterium]